jgi:hypothetical protein
MVTIETVVSAPVVVTSTSAAASAPAIRIGANANFEIKVSSHITKHIAPDIVKEVEIIIPAIVSAPAVTAVIVPGHIKCDGS